MGESFTIDELIKAYFDFYLRENRGDYHWAYQEVEYLLFTDGLKAWEIILKLINAAPSKRALNLLAGGALEELLVLQNPIIIDKVEQESKTNARLIYALTGVILGNETPVFSRIENILKQHDARNRDPVPDLNE